MAAEEDDGGEAAAERAALRAALERARREQEALREGEEQARREVGWLSEPIRHPLPLLLYAAVTFAAPSPGGPPLRARRQLAAAALRGSRWRAAAGGRGAAYAEAHLQPRRPRLMAPNSRKKMYVSWCRDASDPSRCVRGAYRDGRSARAAEPAIITEY